MKVKYKPEDFVVEEILKDGIVDDGGAGRRRFAVYLVTKQMADTLHVMFEIARKLKTSRNQVYSCGLKDKYALVKQFVAVEKTGKLPKKIEGENWEGELVGGTDTVLSSRCILRNVFRITLRDIHPEELKEYESNIKLISSVGFPNYFDEQRFGSARHFADEHMNTPEMLDFIGKRILMRDWEGALKIHFQALSDSDRSRVKKFKRIMREKWGKWTECLVEAQDKNDIEILRHLVRRPTDFKGAFFKIEARLARLYLEVYQDYIFNTVLAEVVKRRFPCHYLFPYVVGKFVFPYNPSSEHVFLVKNLKIPLPHKDSQIPPEIKDIYQMVLGKEKVSLSMFDTGDSRINFINGTRNAWEKPDETKWNVKDDEHHPGSKKIELFFSLRPGTFATIFIKSITPLEPKSETEKKPEPVVYDGLGREIPLTHRKTQVNEAKEVKKAIIISRSTS